MSIDWGLATRVARSIAGGAGSGPPLPTPPAPASLDAVADDARDRVVAATGLATTGALPPVEWVDRREWIDANLATMRTTLGPALERSTAGTPAALRAAAGALVAVEIGALLGMFSRRVLGQYDIKLLDPEVPPRLLMVAPNLANAAETLKVDRDQLITWVTLHEVTHGVQFGGVPWLRPHLAGLLSELLSVLEVRPDPRALMRLDLGDLRSLVERVRAGGLVHAVIGPERQGLLDRVQATMALVEGHAEWTMDRTGADVLENVEELRAALDRRREDRAPLLRILDRLLGFDLKLRQYTVGRRFCEEVVERGGERALLEAWSSPAAAPSIAEMADADAWLRRTRPAA
jgi:coenzyme F420 biosynthesis associated uncharacterized protein